MTVSSPIFFLSEQNDVWIRSKAPGGGGAVCHSITDGLQVLYFERVTFATTDSLTQWPPFWQPFPGGPLISWKREHNVEPLNHPGDGLVWIQERVIILENKRSWIDMLISFSWWEGGEVGFYPSQPREGSTPFVYRNSFCGDIVDHIWYGSRCCMTRHRNALH